MAKHTPSAGGWAALKATTEHVLKSDNLSGNIMNLLKTNQDDGFDCPGCAWGEKREGTRFRFCENGAKAVAWEATSQRVDRQFFAQHSVTWLNQQSDYFLEKQGRLAEPVRYNASTDHFEPISWPDAFTLIAEQLKSLEDPNQAEFYTSGRASNEAAFVYQLFVRCFGTNNFPDCSNMCHEASGQALIDAIGIGKGTVTLEDFEHADAILLFGQNPGTNHPRMLETLASAYQRGARVVAINNLPERGLQRFTNPQKPTEMLTGQSTPTTSDYFSPKLGGDMALVRGMVKCLLAKQRQGENVFATSFIDQHCEGLDTYLQQVDNTSWQHIEQQSGIKRADIERLANIYQQAERVIVTWAMGITQHPHSVATIQEITNLQLLRGQIGIPGAGLCPVRGHSNVQGDRTMGINDKPSPAFLDRMAQVFGFEPPRQAGHNVASALQALEKGQSKVFIGLGGNLVAAAPDTLRVANAMRGCRLTVNIATKLNRSHVNPGQEALILPCLGRTDLDRQASGVQSVTVEDSFSMVHASTGRVEDGLEQMRSEPAIICGIAAATLGEHNPVSWAELAADYAQIRHLIEKVIPGFEQFNQRLQSPGGFYLGNSARERCWQTESGKAQLRAHELPTKLLPQAKLADSKQTVYTLQTIRSHDQYNTTVYSYDDRYRGIKGERYVLLMNEQDIQASEFESQQLVDIQSLWPDQVVRKVCGFKLIPYPIPRGNVAAYFPEANALIPMESVGKGSDTPTSKAVAVVLLASQDIGRQPA